MMTENNDVQEPKPEEITESTTTEAPKEEEEETESAPQWNFTRGVLSGACQDLTEIPSDLGSTYGARTIQLDLSFNSLSEVKHLDAFGKLKTLILDNNAISDGCAFEVPKSLRILSVNNNNISDVATFLEGLSAVKNTLTQLSLLKNPGCPSPYFGSDTDDYARFRLYVVYVLPKLEYLDSTKVTEAERAEAKRRGALLRPRKLIQTTATIEDAEGAEGKKKKKKKGSGSSSSEEEGEGEETGSMTSALPQELAEPGSSGPARFGMCSYVYYGKQSEGNRFILNEDL